MSCPTVLTHQFWLTSIFLWHFHPVTHPQPSSKGGSRSKKSTQQWWPIGGIAAFARKIPSASCSVPCPSSVPFSTSVLNSRETKEAPIAATCSGNGRAKVGSNQRRSAHQQPLGLHFLPGHRLDNPMKFAPGVEHGLTEVLLISFQELGYAWPYLLS